MLSRLARIYVAAPLAALLVPSLASAQGIPSYATAEERINGTVSSYDGKYRLTVRDERGYLDEVRLHAGTVILPTGLRLSAGQTVTVIGRNEGKTFRASEIDTPYHSERLAFSIPAYAVPNADPYAYGYYPYPGNYPYPGPDPGYYPYGAYNLFPGYYGASVGLYLGGGWYSRYGHRYYRGGYYRGGYGRGGYYRGGYGRGGYGPGAYGAYGRGGYGIARGGAGGPAVAHGGTRR